MKFLPVPATLFLVLLFFLPVFYLFYQGFSHFQLSIFEDPFLLRVLWFTYWQAAVSASLSLLLGFVSAFLIREWNIWGSQWLWRLGLMFSSLPALVVALGLIGAWGSVFGWTGVLLGHVFLNSAIPMRIIGSALKHRNQVAEMTATSLGMSRFHTFCSVTMRSIKSSIAASWLLSFLYCSTSLFVVLFLGGGPRFTTLEVALYEAIKLNLDLGKAVQIAIVQAAVGLTVFIIYVKWQTYARSLWTKKSVSIFRPRRRSSEILATLLLWCVWLGLFGVPTFSILRDGLRGLDSLSIQDLFRASKISLTIAAFVVFLSLAISYPYLHWLNEKERLKGPSLWSWLIVLPQFFSTLVIALSLSLCFSFVRNSSILSYVGIVVTQALFVIPLIQFPLRDGFMRLSHARTQIAQSLGANRFQRLIFVELPFMKRYIFLSVLIAVGFSLGEVVSVLLFSPPGIQTLSSSIFQAMSRYRFQEAHAYTVVLLMWMVFLFGFAGALEEKDE